MPRVKFESLSEVPDLVPEVLLIPIEREDLRVPQEPIATPSTTTPLEVGHILFTAGGFFQALKDRLEYSAGTCEPATDFLTSFWMDHAGRAVVRAALDPDRIAPIDMLKVFRSEESLSRPSIVDDDYFFRHFVRTWGILKTRD